MAYAYNRTARREELCGQKHSTVYRYDARNRLTEEQSGTCTRTYSYDPAGNRTGLTGTYRGSRVREAYRYNKRNQLTELTVYDDHDRVTDRTLYGYDPAGNLIQEQSRNRTRRYSYDACNRCESITENEELLQENSYDAEGYRYRLRTAGGETEFMYLAGQPVAESEGGKNLSYMPGHGCISFSDDTGSYLTVTDEQKSVRLLLDKDGRMQRTYQYDAFGCALETEETGGNIPINTPECRLRYNSQIYDEGTQDYYLRFRYYRPKLGRFLQEDVLYDDGLNLYAYCGSNPVVYCDPSGFTVCKTEQAENGGGGSSVYIPVDSDGNPIPLNKQRINGQDIPLPDPEAQGRPHTVLGGKESSENGQVYRQSATFSGSSWPTANGYEVPLSEVHWTNHGRADVHTNPHQHVFNYDFENRYWYRSDPEIF